MSQESIRLQKECNDLVTQEIMNQQVIIGLLETIVEQLRPKALSNKGLAPGYYKLNKEDNIGEKMIELPSYSERNGEPRKISIPSNREHS